MRILLPAILAAVVSIAMPALAAKPSLTLPKTPDTVVERLPAGYAMFSSSTFDRASTETRAARLFDQASRTGDGRLAARADALLAALPGAQDTAQTLRLRAYSAQHRHRFDAAAAYLDRLLAIAPRDADARLSRAQVRLVQGRLDLARRDCVDLAIGVDANHGLLCAAALSKRRGQAHAAATLLERWLTQDGRDPKLRRYALRMRAEAAADAGESDTANRFERTLVDASDDTRTLTSYARYLRESGAPRDALLLLSNAPDTDGLLLERALIAKRIGSSQTESFISALDRRFRMARSLGAEPELRDEAEYQLALRGDAPGALALALRNFETQRDAEDVRILERAALAAGRPEALRPMRAWQREQGLGESREEGQR
jgi:tetratricopeptide (TPR) repeat protein